MRWRAEDENLQVGKEKRRTARGHRHMSKETYLQIQFCPLCFPPLFPLLLRTPHIRLIVKPHLSRYGRTEWMCVCACVCLLKYQYNNDGIPDIQITIYWSWVIFQHRDIFGYWKQPSTQRFQHVFSDAINCQYPMFFLIIRQSINAV